MIPPRHSNARGDTVAGGGLFVPLDKDVLVGFEHLLGQLLRDDRRPDRGRRTVLLVRRHLAADNQVVPNFLGQRGQHQAGNTQVGERPVLKDELLKKQVAGLDDGILLRRPGDGVGRHGAAKARPIS